MKIFYTIAIYISISCGLSLAQDYDSWLTLTVANNNRLLKGAGEQERFRYTILNYAKRLKASRSCDPRTLAKVFPTDDDTLSTKGCVSHRYPAPTNEQFKTRWNPVSHQFEKGYVTGNHAQSRRVKLNLKIPGRLSFTLNRAYNCDWAIKNNKGEIKHYRQRDCKAFWLDVTLAQTYEAQATVYHYRKDRKKTTQHIHTSQWFPFKIKDHIIVAMGDSFGSGEGNPHTFEPRPRVSTGKNKRPPLWLEPRCHRSLLSSSSLATNILAYKHRSSSFSLINLACSGAESGAGLIKDYVGRASASQTARNWLHHQSSTTTGPTTNEKGFKGYRYGTPPSLFKVARSNKKSKPAPYDIPAQTKQLEKALGCSHSVCARQPTVIFLYIGVNDIDFTSSIIDTLLKCHKKTKCIKETRTRVNQGLHKLEVNLRKFHQRLEAIGIDQKTPVFLVKYPNPLTKRQGNRIVYCNSEKGKLRKIITGGQFLGPVAGLLGLTIGPDGAQFAVDTILAPLNRRLSRIANKYPTWHLFDRTTQMLGRGFCDNEPMFQRYFESKDKQGTIRPNYFYVKHDCQKQGCKTAKSLPLPTGAMHPNYSGHREIAAGLIEVFERRF